MAGVTEEVGSTVRKVVVSLPAQFLALVLLNTAFLAMVLYHDRQVVDAATLLTKQRIEVIDRVFQSCFPPKK